jgi:hypothetical protein
MRVTIPEFANFQPDNLLVRGAYTVTINKASFETNTKSNNKSLRLEYLIQSGPEQPTGNPDPTGRIESEFITMGGYSTMKDKGKFVLTKLAKLCEAAGVERDDDGSFDTDDFLQATIVIHVVETTDQNGAPRTNIVNYTRAD